MQKHGYNDPIPAYGQQGHVAGFGNFDVRPESLDEQRARLQQRGSKYEPPPAEEDDSGENDWTVTYTDMVTLLMAFFVILTTIAMSEPKGQVGTQPTTEAKEIIVSHRSPFDGMGISIAVGGIPANSDPVDSQYDDPAAIPSRTSPSPSGEAETGRAQPIEQQQGTEATEADPTPVATKPPEPAAQPNSAENAELAKKLQQMVEQNDLGAQVQVLSGANTVTLRISDKILFSSGKANLEQTGQALVARLSTILAQSGGEISIEGHTDNIPISTAQYPSNWELSAARAAMVLRQLVSLGLPAGKLRAIAYADTKPVKDNSSSATRAENRRVELVISTPAPR